MNILEILPIATGIAISPVPIIAVILMLFSTRAKSNGIAFAVAWFFTIGIVSGVIIYLAMQKGFATSDSAEVTDQWVKLILGLVLLAMSIKSWKSQPKEGEEPQIPKWMAGIDAFTPIKSAGLAMLLSGANPKNLALIIAGGMAIAQMGEMNKSMWSTLAAFVAIASCTVVIPVVYYIFAGESAKTMLSEWKEWLIKYNDIVMFWLLLVVGTILLIKSVPSFF